MTEENVPLLCRFLACKQAHTEIIGIYLVRSESEAKKKQRKTKQGKGHQHSRSGSILNYDNAKLFRVIIECISKCDALTAVTISAVHIPTELLDSLGHALYSCKSNIKVLTIRNTPIHDDGLRVITPHLAKTKFQLIYLDHCGLTDVSCNYLSSIIKVYGFLAF
jgi:hypothetical protein